VAYIKKKSFGLFHEDIQEKNNWNYQFRGPPTKPDLAGKCELKRSGCTSVSNPPAMRNWPDISLRLNVTGQTQNTCNSTNRKS